MLFESQVIFGICYPHNEPDKSAILDIMFDGKLPLIQSAIAQDLDFKVLDMSRYSGYQPGDLHIYIGLTISNVGTDLIKSIDQQNEGDIFDRINQANSALINAGITDRPYYYHLCNAIE